MGNAGFKHQVENVAAQAVLRSVRLLPYPARVRTMGWIMSHLVAPLAGWRKRVRENLALVRPDLPEAEVERLVKTVPDNVGRVLIELYSGRDFVERVRGTPIEGPGVAAMEAARAEGRPLVLVTGHIGNYDVLRAVLFEQGYPLGAIYKPMSNPAFNDHYLKALKEIGTLLYPTDRQGITAFVRHLSAGNVAGIVADVGSRKAPQLTFFGHPAHTPLSAAEWARKYDAVMVPIFGLRQPDGLSFAIRAEAPIAHGEPEDMMQAFNDVLEAVIREHMDQWYWIHRRWKRGGAEKT